jgi:hypothetical protein
VNPISRIREEVNFWFNPASASLPRKLTDVKPRCSFLAMRLISVSLRSLDFLGLMKAKNSRVLLIDTNEAPHRLTDVA